MKIKKWMPSGWWIIVDNTLGKWRYRAGADGIGETTSKAIYVSERQASASAKEHLRRAANVLADSGWTQNRVHLRVGKQKKAFCGAIVGDTPNTQHAFSEPCRNCDKIFNHLPEPLEDEEEEQ